MLWLLFLKRLVARSLAGTLGPSSRTVNYSANLPSNHCCRLRPRTWHAHVSGIRSASTYHAHEQADSAFIEVLCNFILTFVLMLVTPSAYGFQLIIMTLERDHAHCQQTPSLC